MITDQDLVRFRVLTAVIMRRLFKTFPDVRLHTVLDDPQLLDADFFAPNDPFTTLFIYRNEGLFVGELDFSLNPLRIEWDETPTPDDL